MPQFLAKKSFRQPLKDLSESVRQKPFEIRQKLVYIASSTPKIFSVTYMFSSMVTSRHPLKIYGRGREGREFIIILPQGMPLYQMEVGSQCLPILFCIWTLQSDPA